MPSASASPFLAYARSLRRRFAGIGAAIKAQDVLGEYCLDEPPADAHGAYANFGNFTFAVAGRFNNLYLFVAPLGSEYQRGVPVAKCMAEWTGETLAGYFADNAENVAGELDLAATTLASLMAFVVWVACGTHEVDETDEDPLAFSFVSSFLAHADNVAHLAAEAGITNDEFASFVDGADEGLRSDPGPYPAPEDAVYAVVTKACSPAATDGALDMLAAAGVEMLASFSEAEDGLDNVLGDESVWMHLLPVPTVVPHAPLVGERTEWQHDTLVNGVQDGVGALRTMQVCAGVVRALQVV